MPDTITLTEQHFAEIRSTGADVLVSVSETALGNRSGGRIAALRTLLTDRGFAEADLALQGLDHTRWTWIPIALGVFTSVAVLFASASPSAALSVAAAFALLAVVTSALKIGTVTASLNVRCADPAQVSRLLDLLLADGRGEVRSLTWRYDLDPTAASDWTTVAISRASARAARIAEALGVRILGVHAFREEHTVPRTAQPTPGDVAMSMAVPAKRSARTRTSVGESLGAAPSSTERAGVTVHIDYRVGPRGDGGAPDLSAGNEFP